MSVAAACPRCSTALGLSRWCGSCGLDLRSDLPPVDIPESRMAATQEQRWLTANPGAATAAPPQPEWAPPAGAGPALATPLPAPLAAPPQATWAPPVAAPTPVRFAPVWARSLLATRWLSFMFLFGLVALVLDGLWLQEQGSPDWTVDDMVSLGKLVDATAIAQLVVYLIGAALFIVWFHRAHSNLPALGIPHPRRGNGWTIGSWFIPIANLFIPKQLANDVWRSGDPQLLPGDPRWQSAPVAPIVHWWWALWLAGGLVNGIAGNMATAESLDEFNSAMVVDAVAQALGMVSAVVAIVVVKRASRRQEARARALDVPGATRG